MKTKLFSLLFLFSFVFQANSTQNLDYNNDCEQGCMDEANDAVAYDNWERSLYNEPAMNDVEEGCIWIDAYNNCVYWENC